MQKHAYNVIYDSLPAPSSDTVYFDRTPVQLPYTEDFPKLHYHDRYEVGVCLDGEGLFLSGDVFSTVSKGDVIFIPPEICHYSRSIIKKNPCTCRFVYVNAGAVEGLISTLSCGDRERTAFFKQSEKTVPPVLRATEHPNAVALLYGITEICHNNSREINDAIVLRLTSFLFEYAGAIGSPSASDTVTVSTDRLVSELAEYLALHYDKNDTSHELSARFHLSESQLRRRFTCAYGIPPIAYRTHLRCMIAAELLSNTALSVSEISVRTGYTDTSDFYRAFKKTHGVSPTYYRACGKNANN